MKRHRYLTPLVPLFIATSSLPVSAQPVQDGKASMPPPAILSGLIEIRPGEAPRIYQDLVIRDGTRIVTHGASLSITVKGNLTIEGSAAMVSFETEEHSGAPLAAGKGADGGGYNPGPSSPDAAADGLDGRPGGDGGRGADGAPGGPGESAGPITLFLAGQASGHLRIEDDGAPGQRGGRGGDGGRGGNGQQGGRGVAQALPMANPAHPFGTSGVQSCLHPPGRGGNGGMGGPGGNGGRGGNGGQPGRIAVRMIGVADLSRLTVEAHAAGGRGGKGGNPGAGGQGGTPGVGGSQMAGCTLGAGSGLSGSDGRAGIYGLDGGSAHAIDPQLPLGK